jgi:hypothetical protein
VKSRIKQPAILQISDLPFKITIEHVAPFTHHPQAPSAFAEEYQHSQGSWQ